MTTVRRRVGVRLLVLAIGLWAGGAAGIADAAEKDLTGTWTYFVGPRPADGRLATLQLKQDGEKLTGKVVLPGGQSQEIQGGTVTEKGVSFFEGAKKGDIAQKRRDIGQQKHLG